MFSVKLDNFEGPLDLLLYFIKRDKIKKKSSEGRNPDMIKTSSMNKHKRRSYKAYRGQGRSGR